MSSKLREALCKIGNISAFVAENCGNVETEKYMNDIISIVQSALAEPPRYCDVMSLESARKLWFAKEIVPRLDGDLPLGKEVPFEEWFVSKLEQETKGATDEQ